MVRHTDTTTESRARVRFVADLEDGAVVYGYESDNCEDEEKWMFLRNGPLLISPEKRLGIPLWHYHKNAAKEFYVSTELPLIVMFKSGKTYALSYPVEYFICDVSIIYQLEEKDYEVRFNWPSYATECSVDLFEIVKSDWGVHENRLLKTFDNKMSFDNTDCMRAFEKRRRHWSDDIIFFFNPPTYK
jgi:hypothetical protein